MLHGRAYQLRDPRCSRGGVGDQSQVNGQHRDGDGRRTAGSRTTTAAITPLLPYPVFAGPGAEPWWNQEAHTLFPREPVSSARLALVAAAVRTMAAGRLSRGCQAAQAARRRTSQTVTAMSSTDSASSQPPSTHWKGQNRLPG
jgi:hypothetical protein